MLASLKRTIAILVYNRDVCDPCSKIGTYLTDPAFSLLNTLLYHRGPSIEVSRLPYSFSYMT